MNPILADIDLDVFRRYAGLALPRHVSYPMPTWWHDLTPAEAADLLQASRQGPEPRALSLYLHIPFCERACRYCACTRIAQEKCVPEAATRTKAYVDALVNEIHSVAGVFGDRQPVAQIHWGGGTPTYLDTADIKRIHTAVTNAFDLRPNAEIALELDPRVTPAETLQMLRELGFNRASLGIQDFDPQVQEHVNRIQPVELVRNMLTRCRDLGFRSVNFDLIYGLPFQTLDTVRATLEKTIALAPDRIAYYQYAQIPDKIAEQRGLDYTRLPDSETKLAMYLLGQELLTDAGYVFIGLDHYARPDEPLAIALRAGTIQRNFQGMTTGGQLDLIGLGASSIGHLANLGFLQNRRNVDEYIAAANADGAAFRGKRLTQDDIVRQAVMRQIYCNARIEPAAIEAETDIDFEDYFARERDILAQLEADGLLQQEGRDYVVTEPLGRVLLRTIGAVFDAYLEPDAWQLGDRQYFSANA